VVSVTDAYSRKLKLNPCNNISYRIRSEVFTAVNLRVTVPSKLANARNRGTEYKMSFWACNANCTSKRNPTSCGVCTSPVLGG
jgi:hypothetical protein